MIKLLGLITLIEGLFRMDEGKRRQKVRGDAYYHAKSIHARIITVDLQYEDELREIPDATASKVLEDLSTSNNIVLVDQVEFLSESIMKALQRVPPSKRYVIKKTPFSVASFLLPTWSSRIVFPKRMFFDEERIHDLAHISYNPFLMWVLSISVGTFIIT